MTELHPIISDVFQRFGINPGERENDPVQWAEDRLRSAYLLIDSVRGEWHSESGVAEALRRALGEIETADCEIAP